MIDNIVMDFLKEEDTSLPAESIVIKKGFTCSYLDEISMEGLFLRSKVPIRQKSLANNYVTIRKIFSYTVVQPKVTNVEYSILEENKIFPLEDTEGEKLYLELMTLLEWANSGNSKLIELSNKIFEIRVKELKYILANVSAMRLYEMKDGYMILDRYLDFIAG